MPQTKQTQKCIDEQARAAQYLKDHPDGDDVRGAQLGVSDWMAEEAIERTSYESFLESRRQFADGDGFDAGALPSFLFPFQESLVRWALRKGRAAIFADCGLGKTPMFLVWADQIVRRTNGRILIVCPLAVAPQIVREGEKFGVEVHRSSEGQLTGSIIVTNYERLHYFNPSDFVGMVADESSAIKSFNGVRRAEVTEFMRTLKYRLLCTATAAPNDYMELGTSSEALGELGHMDMLGRFFINDQNNSNTRTLQRRPIAYGGPKSTGWRFKGHAQEPFWKWVCSWARAVRRPSDLGFSDEGFVLPPLIEREHVVEARTLTPGMLFAMAATNMQEEREERRRTLTERCEMAAQLVTGTGRPSVTWCHLNDEGDMLVKMVKGSRQISGKQTDEQKEELFEAFLLGQIKDLIIKPKIGAVGLNWQHCNHVVSFVSHSYEQYYQAVRRCWRFGQKLPVTVDLIASEGEVGVKENLKRKSDAADQMFTSLVAHVGDAMRIERMQNYEKKVEVPSWL